MGLQRKKIRKAMQSILLNKTKAEDRVFTNQTTPSWAEDLPAILIYTRSEENEIFSESPREHKRMVNMVVEIIAAAPEEPNLDDLVDDGSLLPDLLDDLAESVEQLLTADDTLNCTASDVNMSSTEFEWLPDGEEPIGSVRLIFTVTYYTNFPKSIDLQDGVSDLKSANVDWTVGHDQSQEGNESPDDIVEATDTVDLT